MDKEYNEYKKLRTPEEHIIARRECIIGVIISYIAVVLFTFLLLVSIPPDPSATTSAKISLTPRLIIIFIWQISSLSALIIHSACSDGNQETHRPHYLADLPWKTHLWPYIFALFTAPLSLIIFPISAKNLRDHKKRLQSPRRETIPIINFGDNINIEDLILFRDTPSQHNK